MRLPEPCGPHQKEVGTGIVPESFRKVSWTLDKKAIKEAINAGEEVKGASLVENRNIQIK